MTRRNLIGQGVRLLASLPLIAVAAKVAEGVPVARRPKTAVLNRGDSLKGVLDAARAGDTIYLRPCVDFDPLKDQEAVRQFVATLENRGVKLI